MGKFECAVSLGILLASSTLCAQGFVYPIGIPADEPTQIWPNPNGYKLTQQFNNDVGHTGVDLANGSEGGEVRSIGQGIVSGVWETANSGGWGNVVLVQHALTEGTFYSLYAHLQEGSVLVGLGDELTTGQSIAKVDCTGDTRGKPNCPSNNGGGSHLHFSVKKVNSLGCGYIKPASCKNADTFENYVEDPLKFIRDHRNTVPNQLPTGVFDEIRLSDGVIRGWTYDPDHSESPNTIQIFFDGPAGAGTLIHSAPTNIPREDVNSAFAITGQHGFEFTIPASYRDGQPHSVHIYGIDLDDSSKSTLLTGSPKSFTLPASQPPNKTFVFVEDFSDNSAGWTLGTEWEIGSATASAGHSYGGPDPDADHTPTADNGVAGVVIGGNAAPSLHPFDYLVSPAINVTGFPKVTLEFYRWLNSDYTPFMRNIVEVFDGTGWHTLWITGGSPGVQDAAWTYQAFDITAFQNPNLMLRFGFEIGSGGVFGVSSWNLDDVSISSK